LAGNRQASFALSRIAPTGRPPVAAGKAMTQQQKVAQIKNGGRSGSLQITDPNPPENSEANWEAVTRAAIIGIAVVVITTALMYGRPFFMPVTAAIIIGITLAPVQKWAADYHVPYALTAILLVLAFFALLWTLGTLVLGAVTDWIPRAPELAETIKEKMRYLERPLGMVRDLLGGGADGQKVAVEKGLVEVAQQAAAVIQPALTELIVFFGTLLFFLIGIKRLRRQLIVYFSTRKARLRVMHIWNDIEDNLIGYLGTVTVINLALGAATAGMLYLLGFTNALALGALAFVLNFVLYIGPAIFALTLFVISIITEPTIVAALIPPALFIMLNIIEGYIVTPSIVGRKLTLSPLIVFISLAFWTWLWGPLGALLATPMLIIGLVVLSHLFPRDEAELPK
jgi:predicted PurR-regulated permease PerM